jgi:DNA-binding response OmpR family regulator
VSVSRILIVEDDPVNGQVLTDFLDAHGYETVLAKSGPEGVRLFSESPPDLVIIDVLLPEKNGFEVAFDIRQSSGGKDLPLIMMSAVYTDLEQAEAYARDSLNAAAYLVKPFELSTLLTHLRELLPEPA